MVSLIKKSLSVILWGKRVKENTSVVGNRNDFLWRSEFKEPNKRKKKKKLSFGNEVITEKTSLRKRKITNKRTGFIRVHWKYEVSLCVVLFLVKTREGKEELIVECKITYRRFKEHSPVNYKGKEVEDGSVLGFTR